jgi:hypothetical protein
MLITPIESADYVEKKTIIYGTKWEYMKMVRNMLKIGRQENAHGNEHHEFEHLEL